MGRHTGILGLRDDLSKQLGEVGDIFTQEAGLENEGLSGVVCVQLTSEELALSGYAQGGSLRGVL